MEGFAEQFGELYRDWLPSGIKPRDAIEILRIPLRPVLELWRAVASNCTSDPASLGHSYQILARILAARLDWYKALEGQEPAPPPTAKARTIDSDWLTRHRLAAVGRSIDDRLAGWPIGIVLEDQENFRLRPTNEGIVATVSIETNSSLGRSFDYWTLTRSGDFCTIRSLSEDNLEADRARKAIYFEVRIARAARRCSIAPIFIKPKVSNRTFCEPLFIIFDFAEVPDGTYRQIVTDFLKGRGEFIGTQRLYPSVWGREDR